MILQRTHKLTETNSAPQLNAVVDQTIALSQEWRARHKDADETKSLVNLDFHSLVRVAGRWMLVGDAVALVSAFIGGGLLAWGGHHVFGSVAFQSSFGHYLVRQVAIFISFGLIGLFWLDNHGHYRQRLPYWEMLGNILTVSVVAFVLSGFVEFVTKDDTSRLWMGLSWLCFFSFTLIGRAVVRRSLDRRNRWNIPALIIGDGVSAEKTRRALNADRKMGFVMKAQVPAMVLDNMIKPESWKHLLATHSSCHIFLALGGGEIERHQAALKAMTRARVPCSIVPPWMGLPASSLSTHHFMMHDVTLMHDTNRLQLMLPGMVKRFVDIALSATALILLWPIFIVITCGVRLDGGPALFKQKRIGKNGRCFECYKFRSMRIDAETVLDSYLQKNSEAAKEWRHFQKFKNDARITRFGSFIRRASLDELPQLINVLIGDMSLVGPRPCMLGQEDLYDEDFGYYTSVRPGITGPWQVSGRNKLTFKERVDLEAWYVRNWNLWMDIVIMLKTLPALLGREQAF